MHEYVSPLMLKFRKIVLEKYEGGRSMPMLEQVPKFKGVVLSFARNPPEELKQTHFRWSPWSYLWWHKDFVEKVVVLGFVPDFEDT
jgi:hypothetical protein